MCTGKAIPFWIRLLPGKAMLGGAGCSLGCVLKRHHRLAFGDSHHLLLGLQPTSGWGWVVCWMGSG